MEMEELERRAKITNETCGGIQPMNIQFYELSIKYSADRCLKAFQSYDDLLQVDGDAEELISAVQEAIGHAASLSRYFWPTSMGKKKVEGEQISMRLSRGAALRKLYEVSGESVIANRDMRNAWEHFDEKLDTFLLMQGVGIFIPEPVVGDHSLADDPLGRVFKLIDTENGCLVLLDKKFFFQPIRKEVYRIFKK